MPEMTIDPNRFGIVVEGDVEDYMRVTKAIKKGKALPDDINVAGMDSVDGMNGATSLGDLAAKVNKDYAEGAQVNMAEVGAVFDDRDLALINTSNIEPTKL